MSNPLFENSRVALGFGAIVIAGGLMAAIALNGFSPKDPALETVAESAAEEAEAGASDEGSSSYSDDNSGFASDGGGWGDGEGFSDDWGTGVVGNGKADPNQDGAAGGGDDASDFGDFSPEGPAEGGRPTDPPGVKSGAAPGAPAIRPPGGRGELSETAG